MWYYVCVQKDKVFLIPSVLVTMTAVMQYTLME
nr:MAG TPA: hypothetical protein [Caudoviricetes sp.]